MTYNSQINLAEIANNQQKMQASHSYGEQNANFLPLNFYVVQMLNAQLEFPCEVAPAFLGGHETTSTSSENRQKHSKHITGKVLQTLFGFLGIFHGKPPIIFDRIALVTCGVNWSAQTRESVFCGLKRSFFHFLSHS